MLLQCKGNDIVGLYKIFRKFLVSGLLTPLAFVGKEESIWIKKRRTGNFLPCVAASTHLTISKHSALLRNWVRGLFQEPTLRR